jgi:Tripartite tricarboxylate transporter family receptor.
LKAIGVGGPDSIPTLPGVAPIAQTLPGFEAISWVGLFVPAGTPSAIGRLVVARMAPMVVRTLRR